MTFKQPLGLHGTVITMVSGKSDRRTNPRRPQRFTQLFNNFANMVDFGTHFDIFENRKKENENNEVQEKGWKQHDFGIDF